MRILFIGGTRFVGLHMAREALRRGHEVTLFHREPKELEGLEGAHHILGNRDSDLAGLEGLQWDAVVDCCGYRPAQVELLAEALGNRAGKFVFISTVSAYAEDVTPFAVESDRLADTSTVAEPDSLTVVVTAENYGPLKVLCEESVVAHYPDALIIRPTFVIGPEDYTNRFTKHVLQVRAGGVVEAPEPQSASWQYIDARDLAAFTINAIEQGLSGAYTVAAPSGGSTYGAMMSAIVEATGPGAAAVEWISVEAAQGREAEFPFWAGGESIGMLQLDTTKAEAAGLTSRPLLETIRDI